VLACSKDPGQNRIPDPVRKSHRRRGMSSLSAGKHAGSSAASDQAAVPEPTFAERARTLMYLGRVGSLSTLSRKQQGYPFGSVMPFGLDEHANPVFLISTMAMHTQNVQADPRSSLLVTQPDTIGNPLGASRVTGSWRCARPARPGICWNRLPRNLDDCGRPSRLSRTRENQRWRAQRPHRILAGGK
jgi:hypothetical protein